MEKDFWLERWVRDETGFHQGDFNPHLQAHWPTLKAPSDALVFVPLCGKTLDMRWLRRQGHAVMGVELSDIAIDAFFAEQGEVPEPFGHRNFTGRAAGGIRLLCGDFFELRAEDVKDVGAVYDRASLVALPPEMRERYVEHLIRILPGATPILLLTFDYTQAEMNGPPFAVPPEEVQALYADHANVVQLADVDALEANPRFRERGLSRLRENVFAITTN